MLNYNVPLGKLNRGMAVVDVARAVAGEKITPEMEHRARILGWCIEFVSWNTLDQKAFIFPIPYLVDT